MRTLVIASGKGGTGKTTLTALFALFAARESTVVVIDADVEASNLPIALNARDVVCEEFIGGSKATIDPDACTGCGACAAVCRFDAIPRVRVGTVHAIDPWACEGCGHCTHVCPREAVRTLTASAGTACVGSSATGVIAFGQLGPGEDLSGKLVTEVRRLGRSAAESTCADLTLIDGPPGIGCPVIAAMADTDLLVAVTEPTLSGEHDLIRLADLALRTRLPVKVVLNKSDLSDAGAARIRAMCTARELPLIAEVPYDTGLALALQRIATDGAERVLSEGGPGISAVAAAWAAVSQDSSRGATTRSTLTRTRAR